MQTQQLPFKGIHLVVALSSALYAITLSAQQQVTQLLHPTTSLEQIAGAVNQSGTPARDLTMHGNVVYQAGSQSERGTVTLKSMSGGYSSILIDLPSGSQETVHSVLAAGETSGSFTDKAGSRILSAAQAKQEPYWFAPEFILQRMSGDPHIKIAISEEASQDASKKLHITSMRTFDSSLLISRSLSEHSRMQLSLDPETLHLQDLNFRVYTGTRFPLYISERIHFDDYTLVQQHFVPRHIVEYVNGVKRLDITIGSIEFNTGLKKADFLNAELEKTR